MDKNKYQFKMASPMLKEENEAKIYPLFKQVIAGTGPLLLSLSAGTVVGYSAILFPQLEQDDSLIKLSKTQESWIASIPPLIMTVACLIGGWFMEKFGRKKTIVSAAILLIIAWIVTYFSNNVNLLMLGRVFKGLSIGICSPATTAYLGEIISPKYRGVFLVTIGLGISFGLFLTHLIGTFVTWKTTAIIALVPPLLTATLALYAPESHVWHINTNNLRQAKRSFYWYRGNAQEDKEELEAILTRLTSVERPNLKQQIKECCKARFIKPFLIVTLYFITLQMSGNNVVIFYSVNIMQATVPGLNKYASMLIVDFISLIMSGMACVLVKKFKVRTLTSISGFGTSASLYLLALFVHLSTIYKIPFLQIAPLIILTAYISLISIGLVPLAWTIEGEILPKSSRGVGGGLGNNVNFLACFLVVKTGPFMFNDLGTVGTFLIYGTFTLLGSVGLYILLPETKGKTLGDIEEYFAKSKSKSKNLN